MNWRRSSRKCWLTPTVHEISERHSRRGVGREYPQTRQGETKTRLEVPDNDNLRTIDFLVALNQRLWKDIKYTHPARTRRANAGGNAGQTERFLPRFGVAAVPVAPALRPRRALCQRLSDPAQARREVARRPERRGKGFHRSARVVRSLSARRRLDWPRPDVRFARGRRPYPAGLHARAHQRRAHHRRGGRMRMRSSASK